MMHRLMCLYPPLFARERQHRQPTKLVHDQPRTGLAVLSAFLAALRHSPRQNARHKAAACMAPTNRIRRASTSFARSLLAAALLFARPGQAGKWLRTAPRGNALPDDKPPASFEGRDNNIHPVGVSDDLDAQPALLQSNKFYSSFMVSKGLRLPLAWPGDGVACFSFFINTFDGIWCQFTLTLAPACTPSQKTIVSVHLTHPM